MFLLPVCFSFWSQLYFDNYKLIHHEEFCDIVIVIGGNGLSTTVSIWSKGKALVLISFLLLFPLRIVCNVTLLFFFAAIWIRIECIEYAYLKSSPKWPVILSTIRSKIDFFQKIFFWMPWNFRTTLADYATLQFYTCFFLGLRDLRDQ